MLTECQEMTERRIITQRILNHGADLKQVVWITVDVLMPVFQQMAGIRRALEDVPDLHRGIP